MALLNFDFSPMMNRRADEEAKQQAKRLIGSPVTAESQRLAAGVPIGEYIADPRLTDVQDPSGYLSSLKTPEQVAHGELYGGLLTTPGYEQIGAQGLRELIGSGGQKPTSLMQNVLAMGHQPGTPEYQKAITDAVMKPSTRIDMGAKYITPADAKQLRGPNGETPPVGALWSDLIGKGYRFVDPTKETAAGARQETLGSMEHSLDTYEKILKEQGAMNITQMFSDPAKYAKLKAAYGDLLLETKELAKLGVLAGPDMDLMEQLMIDPTSIKANVMQFASNKDEIPKQLEVIRDKLTAARKRAVSRYGKNWRTNSAAPSLIGGVPAKTNSVETLSDEELRAIAEGR